MRFVLHRYRLPGMYWLFSGSMCILSRDVVGERMFLRVPSIIRVAKVWVIRCVFVRLAWLRLAACCLFSSFGSMLFHLLSLDIVELFHRDTHLYDHGAHHSNSAV